MPTPVTPAAQRDALLAHLAGLESVLVCYSGGIDSALVLAAAHQALGPKAVGMTAVSPSLPERERTGAAALALELGAEHRVVASSEIEDPNYVKNGSDRCFYCKSELYRIAVQKSADWGLRTIVNGTNVDDLGDHRPGLVAASNAGVRSPLVELGFTKQDVRAVSKLMGLPIWDKPAAACLSSRLPYGTSVTVERLRQIDGFEMALRDLGFRQVRVRYHGELARIEVDPAEVARFTEAPLREAVTSAGRQHGFRYVTLDLLGYRQGSHNEVLEGRRLKVLE